MEIMKRLVQEEEGQGMVEYALIIALVGVLLVATLTAFKDEIVKVFNAVNTAIPG